MLNSTWQQKNGESGKGAMRMLRTQYGFETLALHAGQQANGITPDLIRLPIVSDSSGNIPANPGEALQRAV